MYVNRKRIELHGRPKKITEVRSNKKEDVATNIHKKITEVKTKKQQKEKEEAVNIDCSNCNNNIDKNKVARGAAERGEEETDTFVEVGNCQLGEALSVNKVGKDNGDEINSFIEVKTCRVVEELIMDKEEQGDNTGETSEVVNLVSMKKEAHDTRTDESTTNMIQAINNREEDSNERDNGIKTKTINTDIKTDIETSTSDTDVDSSYEFIEKSDAKGRGGKSTDNKYEPIHVAEGGRLFRAVCILKRHKKKVIDEAMVEMKSIRT